MKCPKCKTPELSKPDFEAPYTCPRCKGRWILDKEIAAYSDSVLVESDDTGIDGNNPMDEKTGVCPSGHGVMLRAKVDIDNPFYLEKCSKCGGIWFDAGEWHRLAQSHLAGSLSEFWTRSWQRKQRKEKDRQDFLSINQRLLGDSLFEDVMNLAASLKDHPEKIRALALLRYEAMGDEASQNSN